MAGHIKTWIEIISNGESGNTHAYVVISVGQDQEFRYEIPGIIEARWECASSRHKPRVELVLVDVVMNSRVEIKSDTVKMEELMTEIVASRLTHEDDEKIRWRDYSKPHKVSKPAKHAPHCDTMQAKAIGDFRVSCNCGAMPK